VAKGAVCSGETVMFAVAPFPQMLYGSLPYSRESFSDVSVLSSCHFFHRLVPAEFLNKRHRDTFTR
jgi:hypothetical protein